MLLWKEQEMRMSSPVLQFCWQVDQVKVGQVRSSSTSSQSMSA